METERRFVVEELFCFPKGCLIPSKGQLCLAMVLVPQLEEAGMNAAEWTRGALKLEEPNLSRVRGIVCGQCNICECLFNPHFKLSDELSGLMDGQYAQRIERGNQVLVLLLSETKRAELAQIGINVVAFQMPSRKNPKLFFSFTRNGVMRYVNCEVGKRRLIMKDSEVILTSLEQLSQKIDETIYSFV